MRRVVWEFALACMAVAGILIVARPVALFPAASGKDAENAGVTIPIRPAITDEEQPAPQYTPSELRGAFPELPHEQQRRTPARPSITRFAHMDLAPSAG